MHKNCPSLYHIPVGYSTPCASAYRRKRHARYGIHGLTPTEAQPVDSLKAEASVFVLERYRLEDAPGVRTPGAKTKNGVQRVLGDTAEKRLCPKTLTHALKR